MPYKFYISIFLFAGIGGYFISLPNPVLPLVLLAIGAFIFYGAMAFCIQCNFFVPSITKTKKGNVLLTFDDGPHTINTLKVLDILKKHNAKAVFFLIGRNAQQNPDLVSKIKDDGHLIGIHSFSHPNNFGFLSSSKVIEEIKHGQEVLHSASSNFFRPPVGITNPIIAKAIKRLNLTSVAWSLRSFDTVIKDETKLLNRILSKVKSRDIILLHDSQDITVRILEELIITLKKRNFTLNAELN